MFFRVLEKGMFYGHIFIAEFGCTLSQLETGTGEEEIVGTHVLDGLHRHGSGEFVVGRAKITATGYYGEIWCTVQHGKQTESVSGNPNILVIGQFQCQGTDGGAGIKKVIGGAGQKRKGQLGDPIFFFLSLDLTVGGGSVNVGSAGQNGTAMDALKNTEGFQLGQITANGAGAGKQQIGQLPDRDVFICFKMR